MTLYGEGHDEGDVSGAAAIMSDIISARRYGNYSATSNGAWATARLYARMAALWRKLTPVCIGSNQTVDISYRRRSSKHAWHMALLSNATAGGRRRDDM